METTTSEFTSQTQDNIPKIPIPQQSCNATSTSETVEMKPISYRVKSGRPDRNVLKPARQSKSARPKDPESSCCLLI